ncbi:hypothetical protein [Terrarubrum flagellatum]|uniref:hypothetical protein n=1 Tax=Terrirubrum flagellatum TaxID=2895980 RepID=UPI00314539BD
MLSRTIRAFSSSDQRRRRPVSTTSSRLGALFVWLAIRTVLNDQPNHPQGVSRRMRTVFVAQPSAETLDKRILHRLPRCDVAPRDAHLLDPIQNGPVCRLRAAKGIDHHWPASLIMQAAKLADHPDVRQRCVDRANQAFPHETVDDIRDAGSPSAIERARAKSSDQRSLTLCGSSGATCTAPTSNHRVCTKLGFQLIEFSIADALFPAQALLLKVRFALRRDRDDLLFAEEAAPHGPLRRVFAPASANIIVSGQYINGRNDVLALTNYTQAGPI